LYGFIVKGINYVAFSNMTMILDIALDIDDYSLVEDGWLNMEFGKKLRSRRKKERMSQDSLATSAGLSRTSIVNVESGRQGVSLATLYRLAGALSCEISDLLPSLPSMDLPRITVGDDGPEAKQAVLRIMQRVQSES